jgi:hypothetical protein
LREVGGMQEDRKVECTKKSVLSIYLTDCRKWIPLLAYLYIKTNNPSWLRYDLFPSIKTTKFFPRKKQLGHKINSTTKFMFIIVIIQLS